MAGMPEDVGIHVDCEELAEVLQLTRVNQKRGKTKRSHWVVLFVVFPAFSDHCFVDLQWNSETQLKGYFLEYSGITIVLVVDKNIP